MALVALVRRRAKVGGLVAGRGGFGWESASFGAVRAQQGGFDARIVSFGRESALFGTPANESGRVWHRNGHFQQRVRLVWCTYDRKWVDLPSRRSLRAANSPCLNRPITTGQVCCWGGRFRQEVRFVWCALIPNMWVRCRMVEFPGIPALTKAHSEASLVLANASMPQFF